MNNWTHQRPKAPGAYWFAGWIDPLDRLDRPAKVYFCMAHIESAGRIVIVGGHRVIYENAIGLFSPAQVPELPADFEESV